MDHFNNKKPTTFKRGLKDHTCNLSVEAAIEMHVIFDAKERIKEMTAKIALEEMHLSAFEIAARVHAQCAAEFVGAAYTPMTKQQLRDYVYQVRCMEHRDWETAVKSHPLSSVNADDHRLFLRCFKDVYIEASGLMTRIICWGHPDLLFQLRHGGWNLFLDSTVRHTTTVSCTVSCTEYVDTYSSSERGNRMSKYIFTSTQNTLQSYCRPQTDRAATMERSSYRM
jgi:hypothetical protein